MRFAMNDEHRELAKAVHDALTDETMTKALRSIWDNGADASSLTQLWDRVVSLDVLALLVPEQFGGLGLDETYLVAVMEEIGYSGMPLPVMEATCVAPLLANSDDPYAPRPHRDCALVSWSPRMSDPVPWGSEASSVVIGGAAEERGLFYIDTSLDADRIRTVDKARPVVWPSENDFQRAVPIRASRIDIGRLWLRGIISTAALHIGLARRMLEMTVGYVCQRQQFGVPIGSFQAVKHQLASAYQAVEFARPVVHRAAWDLSSSASSVPATARRDVAAGKLLAARASDSVARTSIQCHGAMGYTTENDLHMFVKRSWAVNASFGASSEHRRTIARSIYDTETQAKASNFQHT